MTIPSTLPPPAAPQSLTSKADAKQKAEVFTSFNNYSNIQKIDKEILKIVFQFLENSAPRETEPLFQIKYENEIKFLKLTMETISQSSDMRKIILVKDAILFPIEKKKELEETRQFQHLHKIEIKAPNELDEQLRQWLNEQNAKQHSIWKSDAPELDNPSPHYKRLFGDDLPNRLRKMGAPEWLLGWLLVAKQFSLIDSKTRLKELRNPDFGKNLNACMELLDKLPLEEASSRYVCSEFVEAISKLFETGIGNYFFQTDDWKIGSKTPSTVPLKIKEQVKGAAERLNTEPTTRNLTYVYAEDRIANKFRFAKSGTIWSCEKDMLDLWEGSQKILRDQFQENVEFTPLTISHTGISILVHTFSIYVKWCQSKKLHIEHFRDMHKVKGIFGKDLQSLMGWKMGGNQALKKLQDYFPGILPEDKYIRLKSLLEKGNVCQKKIQDILSQGSFFDHYQVDCMALSTTTCGEVKIAWDFCSSLGSLSAAEFAKLPETLGECLSFGAFKACEDLSICKKCNQMWPGLDALYRFIKKTEINLALVVKVGDKLRMAAR